METSSDESFTWGKVSNASDDSTGSSAEDHNKNKVVNDDPDTKDMNFNTSTIVSPETKPKKRKIEKKSVSNEDLNCSPRKKRIKLEPNKDIVIKTNKRKKESYNDSYESTEQQQNDDDNFLNLKVKEELESLEKDKLKKKSKRSHKDSCDTPNTVNDDDNFLNLKVKEELESSEKNKLKKKSKRTHKDSCDPPNTVNELDKININGLDTHHSNTSILDRIEFEDDVDSNTDKDEYSLKVKNYLMSNSIQPITKDIKYCSDITQDDEIWILKCPHDIEVNSFSNKDFALDTKCKIKLNGETYCGILDNQIGSVTIMTKEKNKSIIKNIDVRGIISFRKRLRKPNYAEYNVIQNPNVFIPLPETKPRHPLFGSDYQKAIKVSSPIMQHLREDIPRTVNHDKKKKKISKKDRKIDMNEEIVELKESIAENSQVKKAKKRKHNNYEEVPLKKKKRINKEMKIDPSEVWESEKAIEDNLFNF